MGKLQQDVGILNEGDALRARIAECEKALVSVTPQNVRALLSNVAEAHRLLDDLRASGADVRAEEARLQSVEERMIRQAKPIVVAAGGDQAFIALRRSLAPNLQAPWWALEEVVAANRRRRLKQLAAGVAVLAVIGLIGFLLRGVLFPPNPVGDALFAVQAALRDGDAARALQAIERGLEAVPANPTLLVWKGALLERQNDPAAVAAFESARAALGEKDFLVEKAQAYLMLGENDRVIADMTRLIETEPDPAEAYFIRATAYENKNQLWQAIQDLEAAAQIAQRTANDTLFATARVRMGVLMQSAGAIAPTATP
ncbi:MAG: tetratricopeptide repeat protein [Candidatus Brachytrichaceae bacterium NZ_4S206]|jgi:tetratricopeptide (TPR) repeat protein